MSMLCKVPSSSLPSLLFIPKRSLKFFTSPSTAKHFRLTGSCRNGKRKLTEITRAINHLPCHPKDPQPQNLAPAHGTRAKAGYV